MGNKISKEKLTVGLVCGVGIFVLYKVMYANMQTGLRDQLEVVHGNANKDESGVGAESGLTEVQEAKGNFDILIFGNLKSYCSSRNKKKKENLISRLDDEYLESKIW